jgi:peptide/nickel transport system ATP-binding protein
MIGNALISPLRPRANVAPDTLHVEELSVRFRNKRGSTVVLDGVSFEVPKGRKLGLVGESGSGKSVTCLSMLGLLDPSAEITSGRARLGEQVLAAPGLAPGARRGVSMIFQYPRTALNPIRTIGDQLLDVLATVKNAPRKELQSRAVELLAEVQIGEPERRLGAYPFELSGGQCQRVLIAMALAREPSVLLADEPTTGLDVVTQKSILELIDEARRERGMSTVFVTHDLALAFAFCDEIVVMQRGKVVERGASAEVLRAPEHPYTKALMAATPSVSPSLDALRRALGGEES